MAPPPCLRLLLPLLVLVPGCTARDNDGAALQQALESGRATLAALDPAIGPGMKPGPGRGADPAFRPDGTGVGPAPAGSPPVVLPPMAASVPSATAGGPLLQPVLTAPAARAGGVLPPVQAAELLGLGPGELRLRLGEPALRRPEGPGEIWLYTAAACALDIILYREGHAGLRVAHAAARANGAALRTEAACLSEIAAPRGGLPGGTGA
ncbi:hypothetical protein JYK14_10705 [Siccirubricoccus sp. KC 17139]|uniref:Uncharacterized protein n=1 Tax=Siccirubricoccus soli TaxID=2899147 RepID=A0ABT1D4S7_9PROT|nr:hypothetical protein [Siccirubricoccus soli]MCO6416627.1 hypothetical protein [Siccirubricoccus soli]MCP2682762.1 hypothetical protein [Siccirubricoccus soli]